MPCETRLTEEDILQWKLGTDISKGSRSCGNPAAYILALNCE